MIQNFFRLYIFIIALLIFLFIIFNNLYSNYFSTPTQSNQLNSFNYINTSSFNWPLKNNHYITSYFGPRKSPTSGSSSNHSGIDIGAPEGTPIYSVLPGTVTLTQFKGAGGFTITIHSNNYDISYCHVSPDFIVSLNTYVPQNFQIGNVGPKNVYNVPNNPYKDSFRQADKWCHYWMSSSFDNKKRRHSRQSFRLFLIFNIHHLLPNQVILNYHTQGISFLFFLNHIQLKS